MDTTRVKKDNMYAALLVLAVVSTLCIISVLFGGWQSFAHPEMLVAGFGVVAGIVSLILLFGLEDSPVAKGKIIQRRVIQTYYGDSKDPSEAQYVLMLERNGRTGEVPVTREQYYSSECGLGEYYQ